MPPAMSPAFEPCPIIGIGEAVFEGELPEREALEGLSIVPGPSSGVTPAERDWFKSQLLSLMGSRRAQWGTRVPVGTALGNEEGNILFVQLKT
jgi:hypothetical protein